MIPCVVPRRPDHRFVFAQGIVYFTPALLEQGGISPNSNALYGLTALVGLSKVRKQRGMTLEI